ncbi:MAG: hypothetical protein IIY49_04650 [Eubacterium sp.]|nr:hypothetical protein [Eubacterium sp.]
MRNNDRYAMRILCISLIAFSGALFSFKYFKMGHYKSNKSSVEAAYYEKINSESNATFLDAEDATADNTTEPATEITTEAVTENTTELVTENTRELEELFKDDPSDDGTGLKALKDINFDDSYDMFRFERDYTVADDSYFDKTVFIGDSRTEGLSMYGGQTNMNAFAYKGLTIDHIDDQKVINVNGNQLTVVEAINSTNYDNYYIQFGINEIGWAYVDIFTEDISSLIDIIYQHNPNATIYVSNVAPVTKSISDGDKVIFNIDNIKKFNNALKDMCHKRGDVIYLDIASSVSNDEGYMPEGHSTDGKHYNADLAKRMVRYIKTHRYKKK